MAYPCNSMPNNAKYLNFGDAICIPRSKNGLDFSKLLTRGGVLLIRVKSHDARVKNRWLCRIVLTIFDCFGRYFCTCSHLPVSEESL